jgi:hypothetical protein
MYITIKTVNFASFFCNTHPNRWSKKGDTLPFSVFGVGLLSFPGFGVLRYAFGNVPCCSTQYEHITFRELILPFSQHLPSSRLPADIKYMKL